MEDDSLGVDIQSVESTLQSKYLNEIFLSMGGYRTRDPARVLVLDIWLVSNGKN
jgi:hypothetical protein